MNERVEGTRAIIIVFSGWPFVISRMTSFFSFFISLLYEIERQFLIFIISRTERNRPSKHSAMGPFLLNKIRYGYKLVDRAALTRFICR